MKQTIAWFARNPVAANLVMVVLLVGGALTALSVKIELFPEFALDRITVSVPYPGAAPEEIEEAICVRIEEELHSLDGVKRVSSAASEGAGVVTVEVRRGSDPRRVLDDVRTRVGAIHTFPELAEKPVIEEIVMRSQVINVAVSGRASEVVLKHLAEKVRDEINDLPGISQVQLASARPYEVSIEVSERDLQRYGLTFAEVAHAVRASSLDLSGGTLQTEGGEVLLRAKGQAYEGDEFAELVLLTRPDGSRLLLGDVAQVVDGFEDTTRRALFNGEPMVQVQVFRSGDENAIAIAKAVRRYVDETQAEMPEGVSLTVFVDQSVILEGRLLLLAKNGVQGLLLVFLVLALFMRFRLAFWVTMGIPISFMGALWVLPELDQSLNMLSLFAFILVLGIVVDDAIVVGESIFTEQKRDPNKTAAAVRGTNRVAVPVTFAVLTTVAAFAPMLDLPGLFGKFFSVFPMAVIPILVFSWVESKVILPAHLGHGGALSRRLAVVTPFRWWVAFQGRFERGMEWCSQRVYHPALETALRWRYLTVAVAVATLLVVLGLVGGGFVRFIDFPKISGDMVSAQLAMPLGTSAEVTAQAVRRIEAAAGELKRELDEERGGESVVRHSVSAVGEQPMRSMQHGSQAENGGGFVGSHLGEVVIELIPTEQREDVRTEDLVRRWRELCGPIPGAVELKFSAEIMAGGDAIAVRFLGPDVEELRAAADELELELAALPGVFDVSDSFRGGKQELVLDLLPSAETLGLTLGDLARQVRQAFYGEEVQRIQRGRDEVKVMVRYPAQDRRSLHTLEEMRIRSAAGDEVPFSQVARARMGRGYATINRSERQRFVTVQGDIDDALTTTGEVLGVLEEGPLPEILARHPDVSWSVEGQSRDLREAMVELARTAAVALLAIYAMMAIPFKSYVQPAIVMTAIPFGLVGAVVGHVLTGQDLSILSMLGIVALTGVVVNDSLVLVDFVNRRRAEGGELLAAVRRAGVERFRPILLTSLTTFAGLTPLMFERSVQAQFLVPMAVALAYGVIFATAITLVFVPAAYMILEDLKRLLGFEGAGGAPS